jgi:hypothetical protein
MDRHSEREPGKLGEDLRAFLQAEGADDAARSERALGGVFAALPAVEPRADFAARVMALIEAAPRRVARDLRPAFRYPLAAALVLVGLAAFYLLPAMVLLSTRVEAGSLWRAANGFWVASFERLASLSWVFQLCSQLLEAAFEIAASPPFLLFALGSAAVASVLSRWMWLLLAPSRRSSDAAFR